MSKSGARTTRTVKPAEPVGLGREASTLEVAAELWALLRSLERAASVAERRTGVAAEHQLLLRIASDYEWIAPGRLARIACRDEANVRRDLGALQAAGLTRMARGARSSAGLGVTLTPAGRDRAQWAGSIEAVVGEVLRRRSDDTVASTRRLVLSLRKALDRRFAAMAAPRAPRADRLRIAKPH